MSTLQGKIALVTGGTTGIGLATALAFRDAGARVVVTGTNPDTLARAKDALGPTALVIKADARSLDDTARLAAEIETRFGGLDVAFLNAGIARFAPIDAIDERFYDDIMDVNVKGVVFTMQKILPLLREGASVIVNTSVVASKGVPNASVYSASKGALAALVRALAVELVGRGVRVNAIAPGPIATPIYGKTGMPPEALEAFQADVTTRVPQHRIGAADEVARTALFLASPGASYVTGAEIPVDGGFAAA